MFACVVDVVFGLVVKLKYPAEQTCVCVCVCVWTCCQVPRRADLETGHHHRHHHHLVQSVREELAFLATPCQQWCDDDVCLEIVINIEILGGLYLMQF